MPAQSHARLNDGHTIAAVPVVAMVGDRPAKVPVVVFDSGLGGLTVLSEMLKLMPARAILFAADDAVFPYGGLSEAALLERVVAVVGALIATYRPHVVVIACNTASTVVLPALRSRWPDTAFVGTVPAIKPAVATSRTGMISVLATPGTVAREYTRTLVRSFAGEARVTLVGSTRLAAMAEAAMRGEAVDQDAVAAEIAPAFVQSGDSRTDAVVLACTHYPLLLPVLGRIAPWPVQWIDPAPAIARRAAQVLAERLPPTPVGIEDTSEVPALFSSGTEPSGPLRAFLARQGLRWQPGLDAIAAP